MTGALWALAAGTGFGLFQTLNRRAVHGMDVYMATFVQLVISTLVLVIISLMTVDIHLLFLAPVGAILSFAAAGFIHFLIGWTLLNGSQKRIGAARTSPLIGTTPLFGTVIAAITLRELPRLIELVGIGLIVLGAYYVSKESETSTEFHGAPKTLIEILQISWMGLGAAFFWALSPIFIRLGLQDLPSPLLGVTVGVTASVIGYGIVLLWNRKSWMGVPITRDAWMFKVAAGLLVGLSTWMRWVALDLAPVAVVLALSMISVPLVVLLSPFISGKHLERVTAMLWMGTGLILSGALLLTFN
ncbi:MAG: DMT family transporter [Anaerolineaceae bacterium]|nr:MAG: DMT family transporter [Anaerolineaceae bacterium]